MMIDANDGMIEVGLTLVKVGWNVTVQVHSRISTVDRRYLVRDIRDGVSLRRCVEDNVAQFMIHMV